MNQLISAKAIVGLLSATAITGSMVAGINLETSDVPEHWFLGDGRVRHAVEVRLVTAPGMDNSCEWMSFDPANRVAKCPKVIVAAKRSFADVSQVAANAHDHDQERVVRLADQARLGPDHHL